MKKIVSYFEGDKTTWAIVALIMLLSFMPVYSASTNLVRVIGNGTSMGILFKHLVHMSFGLIIIFFIHKIATNKLKFVAAISWLIMFFILLFTAFQGSKIGGANASRWISIPGTFISIQPSSFGWIAIIMYVSLFLSRYKEPTYSFKTSVFLLWIPVALLLAPIFPSNLSTTLVILFMIVLLLAIGRYPMKYFGKVSIIMTILGLFIVILALSIPDALPSRFSTWKARIERFNTDDKNADTYQIDNAKIAIAKGEVFGVGPGKSVQKNFLPQSSSDFIYAIISEEYGFIGAVSILILYLILLYRILIISNKTDDLFSKYLVVGLGFSIIFQALINMGVAVEVLPTTGQPLPLISSGGSSIWATCISLGIILGVSRSTQRKVKTSQLKNEQEKEFKKILEEQLEEQEDTAAAAEHNPMHAVMGK